MMFRAISVVAVLLFAGACGGRRPPVASHPAERVPVAPEPARAAPPKPVEQVAAAPTPTAPAPRYPDEKTIAKIDELLARIQDAYFDYDRHILRPDAEQALKDDAQTLAIIVKQYPDFRLLVEGHCDERGSDEYNLGLGDARAQRAREYLVSLGLPGGQMDTVSYGKQKPVCTDDTEDCWQKNRRAHLARVMR